MNSLESLNKLLATMMPLLKAIGVPDHQLSIVPKEYKINTLAGAFDWLHNIYLSHEYYGAKVVWKSVSPETWETYALLGITDLTEQKILAERSKPVLKLWKTKRPRLFINRQKELCGSCDTVAVFTYIDGYKQCGNCSKVTDNEMVQETS